MVKFNDVLSAANSAIEALARDAGFYYVDVFDILQADPDAEKPDRTLCQDSDDLRGLNRTVPSDRNMSFHPTNWTYRAETERIQKCLERDECSRPVNRAISVASGKTRCYDVPRDSSEYAPPDGSTARRSLRCFVSDYTGPRPKSRCTGEEDLLVILSEFGYPRVQPCAGDSEITPRAADPKPEPLRPGATAELGFPDVTAVASLLDSLAADDRPSEADWRPRTASSSFDCSASDTGPPTVTCSSRPTGKTFTVGQGGISVPIAEDDDVHVAEAGTVVSGDPPLPSPIPNTSGSHTVRPSGWYVFKGSALNSINWSVWDHTQAKGSGMYSANTCTPDCASANYTVPKAATFTLTEPELLCGKFYWTRLELKLNGEPAETYDIGDLSDRREDSPADGAFCPRMVSGESALNEQPPPF
jgi:hypothetical protein